MTLIGKPVTKFDKIPTFDLIMILSTDQYYDKNLLTRAKIIAIVVYIGIIYSHSNRNNVRQLNLSWNNPLQNLS